ncbi:hypothetical protein C8F04DRAFT_1000946, partial [Mycena alexandri]
MSAFAGMPRALLCAHRCPYPPRRALARHYAVTVVAAGKTMDELRKTLPLGCAVLPPRTARKPPQAPRPKGRPRGPRAPTAHRIVSSLDPLHISAADWITVPSALEFLLRFTRSSVKYKSTFGYNPPLRNIPFPKGLSGFLYYYVPPDPSPMRALLQSGIRLRLAAEPDPQSFATSTDLLDHIGFPWHTPVWAFACPGGATFPDVLSHLHAEGLLSTEQLEQVRTSVDGAYFPPHHTLTLFNRGQEFPIRFEESTLKGVHVMCDADGILRPLRLAQAPLYVSPWMQ